MDLALLAAAAVAAVAAPSAPASVTAYPPAYFAAASPTTALDMIDRLPGFSFDRGGGVRGFGGGAGNVLIDGARPASKDDGLDDALKRIPASSVLRIDLIRGGAPGIDMQGKTIIANVILRTDRGAKLLLAASTTRSYYGRLEGVGRIEGSIQKGATSYEGSFVLGNLFDDGAGSGPRTRRAADGTLILQAYETQRAVATTGKITGAVETPVLGGKLRLNASLSTNPYYATTDDELSVPVGREHDDFSQGQDTAEVGMRYTRPLSAKLTSGKLPAAAARPRAQFRRIRSRPHRFLGDRRRSFRCLRIAQDTGREHRSHQTRLSGAAQSGVRGGGRG